MSTCKGSATFPRRMDQATDGERGKHTAKETTSHWDCTRALVGHRYPQASHNTPVPQDPEGPSTQGRGCCRRGLALLLPSPIPAHINLGADSFRRKWKAGMGGW